MPPKVGTSDPSDHRSSGGFLPNWGEGRNLNLSRFGMKFNSSSRLFKRRCGWGLGPVATRKKQTHRNFRFPVGSLWFDHLEYDLVGESSFSWYPWSSLFSWNQDLLPVIGTEYGCNLQAYFNLNNSWNSARMLGDCWGQVRWCESWTVGPWICLICSSTSFFSSKVQEVVSHLVILSMAIGCPTAVIVSMWYPGYLRGATTCRLKGKMKFEGITQNSDMLKDMLGLIQPRVA